MAQVEEAGDDRPLVADHPELAADADRWDDMRLELVDDDHGSETSSPDSVDRVP